MEAEQGGKGLRCHLSPFLPSPSPRMSAHCARNNVKTESSPQRLQYSMDTDPPQEIRRRFGKKYARFALKSMHPFYQSIAQGALLYWQMNTLCPRALLCREIGAPVTTAPCWRMPGWREGQGKFRSQEAFLTSAWEVMGRPSQRPCPG